MGRQACYGEWLSVCQRRSEKSTIAFQGCPFAPSFRRSSKICSVTNSEQRIIRMLLGRAAEAARNEDWASVRELVAAILRFDAENPDAKIFLEMANAPPALDVQPSDRIPPTSSRLSSSPGDLPESYPRPDRSDFIRYRRKAPSNEVVDIGWSEGVFETGRLRGLRAGARLSDSVLVQHSASRQRLIEAVFGQTIEGIFEPSDG